MWLDEPLHHLDGGAEEGDGAVGGAGRVGLPGLGRDAIVADFRMEGMPA